MPNINIKQEKEEPMEAVTSAPVANPGRKIAIKKKLLTNKGKRKGKASLEKIKVKTFDEIMREKKIKKEKTEGVSSTAEPTPSASTVITVPRTHINSDTPASKALRHAPVQLRSLSIPLMALPKEQRSVRTFIGNPFASVKIKKEPVDPEGEQAKTSESTSLSSVEKSFSTTSEQPNTNEPERELNGTEDNLFIRINNRFKSESEVEDVNHNEALIQNEDTPHKEISSQGASDTLSEPSEESSGQLSTSVDFSDVPLGSNQDDDTMSLFAFDDTFEEEIESEAPRKHSESGQRRLSKERDLRETLQSRSRHQTVNEQKTEDKETDSRTVEDTNMKTRNNSEKQACKKDRYANESNKKNIERKKKSRFSDNEDNSFKVPHADGVWNAPGGRNGNKIRFKKLKENKNKGETPPNFSFLDPNFINNLSRKPLPIEEIQRLQQLHEQVLSATQPINIRASVPSYLENEPIRPYQRDGKRLDRNSGRFRDSRVSKMKQLGGSDNMQNDKNTYMNFRKPPPVPGGRAFFQDFNSQEHVLDSNGMFNKDESVSITSDTWHDKDKRTIALRKLSGDGLIESSNDISNKKTRPTDSYSRNRNQRSEKETSTNRIPLKRRSADEEDCGDRLAKEAKKEKQVLCVTQLRLGVCHHSYCRFVHLTPSELEEHRETEKLLESKGPQDNQQSYIDDEAGRMQEEPANFVDEEEQEQMCKGLAEAANQLLDSLKLGEAWQVIFHLYHMEPLKKPPLIKLLERTLYLCGEDGVNTDVASQVSAQVFDMIPKVRGNYNRHDFTTLIHCLCNTGQYIRGYEVLEQMKKSDITATHEVYLDLIQSSEAKPDWAFDLIGEVKALGLFKSSICSALLLLGSKSGKPLLERTWLLFTDMMENSIKPSKESFLALLDLLAVNDEGQRLLDALVMHSDPSIVPSAKCNKVIIKQSKDSAELVSINVASVCGIAQEKDPKLDVETWNVLLSNCYSDKFHLVSEALQIYSMMKKYNIPLMAEGYNGLLCALSEANQTISAMEVFNTLSLASGHLKVNDYKSCISALIGALIRSKQVEDLESVVMFAVDNGLMVEEKALLLVITRMELEKHFEDIHQLFKKLQSMKEEIPISVFRKLVSTLENWAENPAASLAVYAAMRRAYPIIPHTSVSGSSAMPSNKTLNPLSQVPNHKQKVCKFFTTTGCAFGNTCRFLHPTTDSPSWSNPLSGNASTVNSTSPEKKNPFVLRSPSFPLSGPPVQFPPQPPVPFPMSTEAPCNPLVPPPPIFAQSGPFVLKEPNPLTGFKSTTGPGLPFQMGFPQASLFTPSIPTSAPTTIQPNLIMPNPSTIQPGGERHSLDLDSSVASVALDTRGSQSAPVLSGSHSNEGFHFPIKRELHFYKAKILKATEDKDLEELARLYVQMKKEHVPVNNEMLLLFYDCFIVCKDIGESLSSFVAIIDIQLDNLDEDEDSSQKEALDFDDLRFIGELGVALMQLCRSQKRLDEGYLVLHVLHQYGVNYFQYPASFVPNGQVLSPQSIALLGTDMCLCLEKDPQFDGAVEVLRGCNYAIPLDGSLLSSVEAEKRRSAFERLANHYLSAGNYSVVYELLQHVGDKDVFGMTLLKSIYNELLKKYISEKKVDDAIGVIREMENELISRDPNVLRALVTCLGNIGRFLQANDIFKSSCLQGAYPAFPTGDNLWKATIWINFSKFEIQFYLEQHLQLLNKYIEQHRIASQLPYDEKHFKPLRIVITKEEDSESGCNMTIDAAKQMQERIIEILCSDFNPPLSCGISDKVGEVIVNPRSLRRWFLANPPPELQASPLSESDGSTELQRNVMASKGKPGITIRLDNPLHNDATLYDEYEPRIRHTVCGHLTRYLRQGKLTNKEEFKRLARELTQDFLQRSDLADLDKDYKQVRSRVVTFVDKFFEKRT